MLSKPGITAPIIGASKPAHLSDALAAVDLNLDSQAVEHLEALYEPHTIAGHQ